ncbi:MAG: endonuclease/exonuclease/phosphatase family protein [Rhodospirillaceae bacterium]|jgi:endonuclease/exonuclease/phosphatase family metal-dependent hydrolase|nr:endonuclease/exonuclease/phosphatase family protein [Rhodospirillaceae bacterium]
MRLKQILSGFLLACAVAIAAPAAAESVKLKVMIFNIWRSGVQLSLQQVVTAIKAADPDIVALQEPEGNSRRIADMLGWAYADERVHLISRFPLYMGTQDDVHFSYVEVRRGGMVAVSNLHLPSDAYGPELVRDGKTVEDVLQGEADNRMYMLEPYAAALPKVATTGIPVILGGDFNSPSHLDWTEAMTKARPAVKYPVEWPESKLMADSGFVDSYRAVHPDPVAKPGLTWTPGYPHPFVRPTETHDRIDYIYSIGAKAVESRVVGEGGGPDVEIGVDPWPADHRALLTTFEIEPAPTPDLITVEPRLVKPGEVFILRVATQKQEKLGVFGIYPPGAAEDAAPITSLPCDPADHLAAPFGTARLQPGEYLAAVSDANGKRLASVPFWVTDPAAKPGIAVAQASVKSGDPVEVSWSAAPGNKFDWLGIYNADDPDLYNYLGYLYTNATVAGTATFTTEDFGEALPPGDYEARLMRDDAYVELAITRFTVTAP